MEKMLLAFSVNKVSLETLIMSCFTYESMINSILGFKELRQLQLKGPGCNNKMLRKLSTLGTLEECSLVCLAITNRGVVDLVRQNPRLKYLELDSSIGLTTDLWPYLLAFTENRPHTLNISIKECMDELCDLNIKNLNVKVSEVLNMKEEVEQKEDIIFDIY